MKLTKLRGQSHEVETPTHFVLISYVTPVAAYDKATEKAYRTERYYSTTTSRHISHWEGTRAVCEKERIPQGQLESLVS